MEAITPPTIIFVRFPPLILEVYQTFLTIKHTAKVFYRPH